MFFQKVSYEDMEFKTVKFRVQIFNVFFSPVFD